MSERKNVVTVILTITHKFVDYAESQIKSIKIKLM